MAVDFFDVETMLVTVTVAAAKLRNAIRTFVFTLPPLGQILFRFRRKDSEVIVFIIWQTRERR